MRRLLVTALQNSQSGRGSSSSGDADVASAVVPSFERRQCPTARKVTVGLASHRPRVTEIPVVRSRVSHDRARTLPTLRNEFGRLYLSTSAVVLSFISKTSASLYARLIH